MTSVKDGSGTHAVWDETFIHDNILESILNGEEIIF